MKLTSYHLIKEVDAPLIFPIKYLIAQGIPKVEFIGNISSQLKQYTRKIFMLLKTHKLIKFKQIIIEFPWFSVPLQNPTYIDEITTYLLFILQNKTSSTNKNTINNTINIKHKNLLLFSQGITQYKTLFLDKTDNPNFIQNTQTNKSQDFSLSEHFAILTSNTVNTLNKDTKIYNLQNIDISKQTQIYITSNETMNLLDPLQLTKHLNTKVLKKYGYIHITEIIDKSDCTNLQYIANLPEIIINYNQIKCLKQIESELKNKLFVHILNSCSCGNFLSDNRCYCTKANISKYFQKNIAPFIQATQPKLQSKQTIKITLQTTKHPININTQELKKLYNH